MANIVGDPSTQRDLPVSGAHNAGLESWSCSIVAAAMKLVWAMPLTETDIEVRRRIARAEALRIGRRQRAGARPPVPEDSRPPSAENRQPL